MLFLAACFVESRGKLPIRKVPPKDADLGQCGKPDVAGDDGKGERETCGGKAGEYVEIFITVFNNCHRCMQCPRAHKHNIFLQKKLPS